MKIQHLTTLLFVLAASGTAFAQSGHRLPAATADDLVASRLVAAPDPGINAERAPVQFAWKLKATTQLETAAPFVDDSQQFWANVSAKQMQRGYAIDTTAPGAVIRISPQAGSDMTMLSLSDLELSVAGKYAPASRAVERATTSEELRQAGADFSEGTIVFRVRPELGKGQVALRAANARGNYLVHVYEPASPYRLRLSADRDNAVAGGQIAISARMYEGELAIKAGNLGGLITAPDGTTVNLRFVTATDGSVSATADLPADASAQAGLWEVHTFAATKTGKVRVLRDAKTAIAVSAPTARFAGDVRMSEANGVRIALAVETAAAGRYQASGVLYGSDAQGRLQPMAAAQTAAWIDAGTGELALQFGPDVLDATLKAPYALRDLRLFDQTRMAQLERRSSGIEALGGNQPTRPTAPAEY
ncbi:MAG: DUF4785 family protein [Xanthomonadaceae bacterium]|nr:DUF4785 family protein [Xanthomonadaceae bacterium]MDP2185225.1 DUF4785 family protein [Xanthomonadales bacterium]MDZ4116909.1 DUF4785 family protein [Xanthomonadaceae bacterium]MDZ4379518.1 DUF4785 family protein [Xanthomonadaceae bacterium]